MANKKETVIDAEAKVLNEDVNATVDATNNAQETQTVEAPVKEGFLKKTGRVIKNNWKLGAAFALGYGLRCLTGYVRGAAVTPVVETSEVPVADVPTTEVPVAPTTEI